MNGTGDGAGRRPLVPGEIRTAAGTIVLNAGREKRVLSLTNTGDRPVQIGSHLHLPDANPALEFDRTGTRGFHLDIPAGTSLRCEPGVEMEVTVVKFGGNKNWPS